MKNIIQKQSSNDLFEFMEDNVGCFFAKADVPQIYNTLKDVNVSTSEKPIPKLIVLWLAFLCGDYANLFSLLQNFRETDLSNPQESSMFYSLKALTENVKHTDQGIKYAKLSIDVLPDDEESFYMANAKLTYAQLLAHSAQHRLAASLFADSYEMFYSLSYTFPAVVALVNEALNRYHLGQIQEVIKRCNQALIIGSSYMDEMDFYWHAVHLPLGMCYYQLNKPSLAVEHLTLAKASIDRLGLLHMHGLVELCLFKSYYLLEDRVGMKQILDDTVSNFKNMNRTDIELMAAVFSVFTSNSHSLNSEKANIEKLEIEYIKNREHSSPAVIDTLVYLQLQGYSNKICPKDLERGLERLRYLGRIPRIQQTLVQLAELYYLGERYEKVKACIKEAVNIYIEHGISACFHTLPMKTLAFVKQENLELYKELDVKPHDDPVKAEELLTAREKEVMQLIAQGRTNSEMSELLFITVGTVKWHINNIFSKLGVNNRVQAIKKAQSLNELI